MTDQSDSPGMDSSRPVIAAVDGSAESLRAAAWAAADAALHGCTLRLVCSAAFPTAYGLTPIVTDEQVNRIRTDAETMLTEVARAVRDTAPGQVPPIGTEVIVDPIIPHLIARSRRARLVVVGNRGQGMMRRGLLGSVSSAMVRHAHCPVAVVHADPDVEVIPWDRPVLVGVDGTVNSVPAVRIAFEEASLRKVALVALHAWSDTYSGIPASDWEAVREYENALLAQELAGYQECYPDVPVRRILVCEQPARSLVGESGEAQLVVVGSHGRGGFAGMLLGSTSAAVVQSAQCPVIVARA